MPSLSLAPFDRYRPIVDEWDAFAAALHEPLPTCIWTNTLRTTSDALYTRLIAEGLHPERLAWYNDAFRLASSDRPGSTFAYTQGLFHIQEEVALLPPLILAPPPDAYGLDLCAAPGNKTAQLAVLMGNTGRLIANDRSAHRLRVLATTIRRLGLTNTVGVSCDATAYPTAEPYFDFVMADVPCSCEGTSRKHPSVIADASPEQSHRLARTQVAVLERAVQVCKPGGRIVYATCTYAPEENEGVVHTVLQRMSTAVLRIVPWEMPEFVTASGLTSWNETTFHDDLRHTRRIWPHHNDTGGFYIALLEKRL